MVLDGENVGLAVVLFDPFVLKKSNTLCFFCITHIIESTSALDLEAEIDVWNSLTTELHGSTVICVTHVSELCDLFWGVTEIAILVCVIIQCYFLLPIQYPRRLRNVDRILVMSKGYIVSDIPFVQF